MLKIDTPRRTNQISILSSFTPWRCKGRQTSSYISEQGDIIALLLDQTIISSRFAILLQDPQYNSVDNLNKVL